MTNETEDRVTVNEAARLLDVTTVHVGRLIKGGTLKAHRTTPRKTMVCTDSIDALIKANNT